jgi:hypothetical protein
LQSNTTVAITAGVNTNNNACAAPTLPSTTITVNPPPTATITGPPNPSCVSTGYNISANTVAGATYTWNCGGCTPAPGSTAGPFNVSWSTPGPKTITLTLTAPGCNPVTSSVTFVVNPLPNANFTAQPSPTCVGSNVTLQGTSVSGATYTWNCDGCSPAPGNSAGAHTASWSTAGERRLRFRRRFLVVR